jgi:hypothetical protein
MVVRGWLVSVLILLPNLLWLLFPPRGAPVEERAQRSRLTLWMEALEWAGRLGTLAIPFFYRGEVFTGWQAGALVVMALSLLLYYAGWVRYFLRGREYRLLFEPFLGVPLPLAVAPMVYFLAAAVVLASWPLAVATVVFAVGHLYTSRRSARIRSGKAIRE